MKNSEATRRHLRWLRTSTRSFLALAWLLSAIGCSRRAEDCNYTLTCVDSGEANGTGGAATTDAAGCDLPANCPANAPFCNSARQCVQCLADSDCTNVAKSACRSGVCTACDSDNQCQQFSATSARAATKICKTPPNDAGAAMGVCVQCTVGNESPCGDKSCNPATNQCTNTAVGTVDYCHACVADSECTGGNQANPTARCVLMNYGTAPRGNYCLPIGTTVGSCPPPFGVLKSTTISISGAAAQSYCGINESTTTCEAVQDLISLKGCSVAADCGCINGISGSNCAGGTCPATGTIANTCTIGCAVPAQCPSTLTCSSATPICH